MRTTGLTEMNIIKEKNLHNYKATLIRLIDADTAEFNIQLGFYINFKAKIRLIGINAPEKNTPEGRAALEWLRSTLPEGHEVVIDVYKAPEKYGRWMGIVIYNGVNINQELVKSGHAVEYWGEKR